MWEDFGFSENPYSHRPVPASEQGERLFVGRDRELTQLKRKIRAVDTHPTIEGANGIGKTSLVAIASYQLFQAFLNAAIVKCFIPMPKQFQITAHTSLNEIKLDLYRNAVKFLHENKGTLAERGLIIPETEDLYQWLTKPIFASGGGGVTVLGSGVEASHSTTPNEAPGFNEAGFMFAAQHVMEATFPNHAAGGFICILDNLEILETSKKARETLEQMRDDILKLHGFHWVICGARGIVRSVASSPRLQGVLADPIVLNPIKSEDVENVIGARINEYSTGENSYAPVEKEGFSHIFGILNHNLRDSLKFCSDYAEWIHDTGERPANPTDKLGLLEAWLGEKAEEYHEDTRGITPRAWSVFEGIVEHGGSISPSHFSEFGFESGPAMRPHIKNLEDANLLMSSTDETDSRRKTISLTSTGWIVHYFKSGYKETRQDS